MKKIECKQCGTCCIKGGPVLHSDDLPLLTKKVIQPDQLVVIRQGEPAYNPTSDAVEPASCEMLKIQGKAGSWQCLFYDAALKSCTIHDSRPLECRVLQCRDTTAILAVSGQDCLQRQDILADNDPLIPYLQAMTECSWEKINALLITPSTEAIEAAEKILCEDLRLREQAITQLHLTLAQEFFYFGRPMFQAWNHPGVMISLEKGMPRLRLRSCEIPK